MPNPTDIKLHQKSRKLEVSFDTGETFELSCEYLRVHSQSAEVTGHAPSQAVLQVNKERVNIENITPVGNYAIKLHFDDGHDTGLYTWQRLYELGKNHSAYWQSYLDQLKQAGHDHSDMPRTPLKDIL